ncbi:protein phosphatase [Achlya hypogyna]|uniref:Protein phosphatase n=1 Tax=Achlya hypogyna TaxID=1202772 RepID=A0A1V9ZKK9_ACHHY|nr:protein phosphatase [Achlya hypogyna]
MQHVLGLLKEHALRRSLLPKAATLAWRACLERAATSAPQGSPLSRAAAAVVLLGFFHEYGPTASMEGKYTPIAVKLGRQNTRAGGVQLRKRNTTSDLNLLISSAEVRGDRATMEDAVFISPNNRFAAIFDGHGGAEVAQFLKERLYTCIAEKLDDETGHTIDVIERALRDSFAQVDKEVIYRKEWQYQGSTATAVFLIDDLIWSMNVGDCRAVLCRNGKALALTRDHKPNDPIEKARVERMGGRVDWHGLRDARGNPVPDMGAYRINSNLAVARAFGDRDQRPYVTAEMELKCFRRDPDDKFIVVASDGLWDVFTSAEVVTFVLDVLAGEVGGRESWRSGSHADTSIELFEWKQKYQSDTSMIKASRARRKAQMATYLIQEALYRGTADNVSVAVLWLDGPPPTKPDETPQ